MLTKTQLNRRYILDDVLGKGAMGTVYRATDRLTGQTIALKQVNVPTKQLAFASQSDDNQDSSALRLALAQEFRVLATLRHPNIVSVLDYGFTSDNQPFFTMSLLEDSQDIVGFTQSQPIEAKVSLLIQTLQALQYLHRRGIMHRDLKPANVQVIVDGTVKVLDFGLSVKSNQTNGVVGTLAYMAPEILTTQIATKTSDIYSVGMLAYEIFLGKYPFETNKAMRLMRSIVRDIPDVSTLDNVKLATVLGRWLHKDPDTRYQTADEVIVDLCSATDTPYPQETVAIRESYLNASKLVGRESELQLLDDELEATKSGKTNFYLIGGESGIGKSRLVEEVRVKSVVKGLKVYKGQAVEGGGLPLQIWRSVVAQMAFDIDITPVEVGIIKTIVPDIENILAVQAIEPSAHHSNPQERLFTVLLDMFQRIESPTLIILEDLQWTKESLSFLQRVMQVHHSLSHLMIVGTFRNDESLTVPDKLQDFKLITLERLSRSMIASLSEAMLGEVGQEEQFIDMLTTHSEGNTFFMIEVVRFLAQEAGNLRDIANVTLPSNILTGNMHNVLQRRLAQIPPTYQPHLEFSAVAGRDIDYALLQVAFPTVNIDDWLFVAESVSVLSVQDNQWQFAHDKLREAVIDDLSDEQSIYLHREVATALEYLYPNDTDYNEVLLDHWHQAQDTDKELYYLRLVAEHLVNIVAEYDRAKSLIQRGLNQLDGDDKRGIDLLYWLTVAYQRQGNLERGNHYISQAYELAKRLNDKPGIALTLKNYAEIEYFTGTRDRALRFAQESLVMFQELGNQYECAYILSRLGVVYAVEGYYEKAYEYYMQSLTIREEINDTLGIAIIKNNFGMLNYYQGKYKHALDDFLSCIGIYQSLGEKLFATTTLSNIAWIYAVTDDSRLSDAIYKALEQSRALNAKFVTIAILPSVAKLYLMRGDTMRCAKLVAQIEQYPTFHGEIKERTEKIKHQLQEVLAEPELSDAYAVADLPTFEILVDDILSDLRQASLSMQ